MTGRSAPNPWHTRQASSVGAACDSAAGRGFAPRRTAHARRMLCALAALWCVGAPAPAAAHPVPFSYLDLRVQPAAIEGALVVHVFDVAHDLGLTPPERLLDASEAARAANALTSLLARRLTVTADGRALSPTWGGIEALPDRSSLRLRLTYPLTAPAGAVGVTARLFPYDPQHQTFVNMYDAGALTQAILNLTDDRFDYVTGSRRGAAATIGRFLPSGIHHILIGPDHLLFLVGLLLLGGTLRRLALVVTAFTLAHSLTLSLAALQIVMPPARLVEPAIALSIVYVGADNLLVRNGRDVRAWIAFAFGFIHGFGFANVLQEMDLPQRALGWALFSFNLGVEIGQLLVVMIVAAALGWLRARSDAVGRRLAFAGSIAVIAAGTFWFVQRVFFVGGMS